MGAKKHAGRLTLSIVIVASVMALFVEGVQLWQGGSAQVWVLGAVFGAAVVLVATRFMDGDRRLAGGEAPAAVAAGGLALLLGLAALVGVLPDRNASDITTPPLPGADLGIPSATPGTTATSTGAAGPATKGTHGVVLASPANGADVHRCEMFSGTAKVPSGQTLMLAVKNTVNHDENSYFQPVVGWDDPAQLSHWSGAQFFGSRDDSVGQNYEVKVVLVKMSVVKAAMAKGGWYGTTLPKDSQVALTIRLHRVAGPGPSICS